MSKKNLSMLILTAVFLGAVPLLKAASLLSGTKLGIEKGVGADLGIPCSSGSCLGYELSGGLYLWMNIGPGLDGGFIVGKSQKCGPQAALGFPDNIRLNDPGELTAAFYGYTYSLCTDPGGEQNRFSDTGCSGAGCIGNTELNYLYLAFNGSKVPMGSSSGCFYPNCSADQKAGIFVNDYQINPVIGGAWNMDFASVIPGVSQGVPIKVVFRGQILGPSPTASPAFTITVMPTFTPTATATSTPTNTPTTSYCGPSGIIEAPTIYVTTNSEGLATWQSPSTGSNACRLSSLPQGGDVYMDPTVNCGGTYKARSGFLGQDTFTYVYSYITYCRNDYRGNVVVTVAGSNSPPTAGNINVSVVAGDRVYWTPLVSDPNGDSLSCKLANLPQNGTATVSSDCSLGSYQSNPGFIGTDSFSYTSNDGQSDSNPGIVTVAVTEPGSDTDCSNQYPVSQFTQTGKDGTIAITFTGNITTHTNKVVKVCPGTSLKYQASSTKGPVVCKVKNNTTRGSGSLKINDNLKCTDKPAGKDKVHFKVKSGVK